MKQLKTTFFVCMLMTILRLVSYGQSHAEPAKAIVIEPFHLLITTNKTTNLIFPFAIRSVDLGSPDVLAQKAAGVENILYVKAATTSFIQSSVSVITSDGKLYSFVVDYSERPPSLNFSFVNEPASLSKGIAMLQGYSEAEMQSLSKQIATKKRMMHGFKVTTDKITFQLNGIYVKDDVIYLAFQLRNQSFINLNIEMLRFFIKDEWRFKRTASQEIEMEPLFIHGDTTVVKGKATNIMVFALERFTIPQRKYLTIQVMERNGGRHVNLRIRNHALMNARIIKIS